MAQLEQLTTRDIWCPDEGSVEPGKWVRHVEDDDSLGVVVARVKQDVSVLWSRQPVLKIPVQTTPVQAQSRKLNVQWSAEQARPLIEGGYVSKAFIRKEIFEIEEEYESISYEEVQKLHEEGADIRLHSSGATVKRKTDELPENTRQDGRIRRQSISQRRW